MGEVLTGKAAADEWAKLEAWLARDEWTPDEAIALLAGHYPDENALFLVPNGRPRAWKGKSAGELADLARALRDLLREELPSQIGKKLEATPPVRWLESSIEVGHAPAWLAPALALPKIANRIPARLRKRIESEPPSRLVSEVTARLVERAQEATSADREPYRLDHGTAGRWSYLDPDAVEAILAAPGHKLVVGEGDHDAIRRALRDITFELLHRSFGRAPTREEVARVRAHFQGLTDAIGDLRELAHPVPLPPAGWQESIRRWVAGEEASLEHKPKRGRPPIAWDRYAYPRLRGFYELAFGSRSAGMVGGPAFRFVHRYLSEVSQALDRTEFRLEADQHRVRRTWQVPDDDALHWKIRNAKPNKVAKVYFRMHRNGASASNGARRNNV